MFFLFFFFRYRVPRLLLRPNLSKFDVWKIPPLMMALCLLRSVSLPSFFLSSSFFFFFFFLFFFIGSLQLYLLFLPFSQPFFSRAFCLAYFFLMTWRVRACVVNCVSFFTTSCFVSLYIYLFKRLALLMIVTVFKIVFVFSPTGGC